MDKKEVKEFLEESVEWLKDQDMGCCTYKLDDKLAICVGWLPGYDESDEDVIHSSSEPSYGINAGIKVWTSDDMRTDYEFINAPYYKDGDVLMTDVSIKPDANLDELVDYFEKEYDEMKDLELEDDGEIIEKKEEVKVEDEVEESCKKEESCKVKESWEGENIIDDLVERAQDMLKDGGYGDINDCVAQAIDDGLIYTDDIYELARHYGTLEDSEIIESYYDDLFNDVASRVEEVEEEEEDDFDYEDDEESSEE